MLATLIAVMSNDIPLVDLDKAEGVHVIVDREPGKYLGHPTTVTLPDGRILCVYPNGHGRGAIRLKESRDGGRSWSEQLPVPENWATSQETPTIHLIHDPVTMRPRLLLFSGLFPARISSSDDLGKTWTPLEDIGDWGGIVVMSSVKQYRDGRIIALFHDDGRFFRKGGKAGAFTLYQIESIDGGRSWTQPRGLYQSAALHLCEPGYFESADRRHGAMLLRENSRRAESQVMFTHDEGRSWTAPVPLPRTLKGDRHTGVRLHDGRLFISFRDMDDDSPTKGDWIAWVGTWEDIVHRRPGQYRIRIKDNLHSWDCGYPGVEVLPDGQVLAVSYGHWTGIEAESYVIAAQIDLKQADVRAGFDAGK